MDDQAAFAEQVFNAQAFSQYLGARLESAAPGTAEISVAIGDNLKQHQGFAHGGVLCYLADNAITFAGGLGLGGDAVTSEFKINYLRPGIGTRLVARAEARSIGKRQATCQCDVYCVDGGEEKLCAVALGTVLLVGQ
ncbi:PaaI family thioesterase [Aquisalimonas lutea]|uniref:PaaI family thioesterase n=1 Tax=Aquisalimonas lutea TaxID=1327750 RepID=UPI0025B303C8|nr:PaaI family thioesterase [Aquisalimonas lutea]MDN3519137.1 PaaI family thioesterase [Aquisalimonas lutea]